MCKKSEDDGKKFLMIENFFVQVYFIFCTQFDYRKKSKFLIIFIISFKNKLQ